MAWRAGGDQLAARGPLDVEMRRLLATTATIQTDIRL